jgi:cytoskeletal protein CcmA (bactofilin family)
MFQKSSPNSRNDDSLEPVRSDRSERGSKRSNSGTTNVILSDVEIVGTVRFKNDVVIDGRIEGEIHSDGSVTVGKSATVKAGIRAKSVVVEGSVVGNIIASDRLELMEHAEVTGDISAAILSMQAGAVLVGSSKVGSVPASEGSSINNGRGESVSLGRSDPREERSLAHA